MVASVTVTAVARAVALSVLVGASGCGVRKGEPDWIGDDAAVVRCTVAGPNLSLPRLFDQIPSPAPPTGLYARVMDPIALDELGYQRDRVVCASLQAPDAAQLDRAEVAIAELHELRRGLVQSTRALGGCRCHYADRLDARALVPGCYNAPTRRDCDSDSEALEALREQLAPLRAKLAEVEVPRTHWRLSGRTDRLGRFVARHDRLIARHSGGSEVFLAKTPLPPQPGTRLIAGLLAVEGVVAVVRQDGGRGLLVVRELDDALILDHFADPDWYAAGIRRGVDPELHALLGHIEDAQLPRYRAALAPPSERRKLLLDPRKGYTVELDHAALERVDRAILIAAAYAQLDYDQDQELRELPPLVVDRIGFQVLYGSEGEALRARLRLTDEGRQWLASVAKQSPVSAAATLSAIDVTPSFAAGTPGFASLFLLRGQPIEQALFAGPPGVPKLLVAIGSTTPAAIDGVVGEFEVELPTGPLPGQFGTRRGLAELRERISVAGHRVDVELVDGGGTLALELSRR
jgi:hypothetical protein